MLSLWNKHLGGLRDANTISSPLKVLVRYATKKASGSRTSNKDSAGRRLGMKLGEGEACSAGEIIYRQRGTKFYPGENAGIGKDHTIFAKEPGYVRYYLDPFHPKRKFIGIALSKHERLPTPHFAPRRRRFGHPEIENAKYAELEKQSMSRKEALLSPQLQAEFSEREAKRAAELIKIQAKLSEIIDSSKNSSISLEQAAKRILAISRHIIGGGRTYEEAKSFVDADYLQAVKLDKEFGRKPENACDKMLQDYKTLCDTVDSSVLFVANKLYPYASEEELVQMKSETLRELETLVQDKELPLSDEIKQQVNDLLDKPCFDAQQRKTYFRKLVKKAPPMKESEEFTLDDMKKLVKKGRGSIVATWNSEKRKVENVFLPKGTPKVVVV